MTAGPGLTIAVPRGALFEETLDLLDKLGLDTAEVRSNDRKLIFPELGVITMRPSDVPTYVEHGAADLGIVGKDVLTEQSDRDVYELVDLGYGTCRMVVAAREGDDSLAESQQCLLLREWRMRWGRRWATRSGTLFGSRTAQVTRQC